ncbi:MAG: major facilitator superfamily [Planctomycetota bacterium]|nr:MAG: major facilitator superfamily [Planctomycetota bacterium]
MSNPLRRYPPELWLLFFGRVITATGYSFSFPFFAIYCAGHLKIPMGDVGAAFAMSGFAGMIARFCGGELADRLGRKIVMQGALAGRALTSAGIAWQIATGAPFWHLAATFVASNFAGQIFEPSSQAYVADISTGRMRAESFGFVRMGINAGWALGMILNAIVTESYVVTFAITAGVFALSLLLFSVFLREPPRAPHPDEPGPPLSAIFANRPFLLLAGAAVLLSVVWSQLVAGTSMYASGFACIPDKTIAWILAVNGTGVFLLQIPATRWMGRIGLVPALVTGCLLYGAGYGSYTFCTQPWHFALAIAVVTCGEVLCAPAGASLATELAPLSQRGRYLGAYMLTQNSGQVFGPYISGQLLQRFPTHPGATWFTIAGIAGASAIAHLAIVKLYGVGKRPPAEVESDAKPMAVAAEKEA